MAALKRRAFFVKWGRGVGKFKREGKLVASIEDRNLDFRSNNEMLFHSRMNVMSSMRGGEGFRVPPDAVCTSNMAPRRDERKESQPCC